MDQMDEAMGSRSGSGKLMTRSLYAMSIEDQVILERRLGAGIGVA